MNFRSYKAFAAGTLAAVFLSTAAQAQSAAPDCGTYPSAAEFNRPLPRMAGKLAAGMPLKIVAIGSSSTAGVGASTPEKNYVSRLETELKTLLGKPDIEVINAGRGGDRIYEMRARLYNDAIRHNPDAILLQGAVTNSLLRGENRQNVRPFVAQTINEIQEHGVDVILIDPQDAPKVTQKEGWHDVVTMLSNIARDAGVNLFQRFNYMQSRRKLNTFITGDDLHLNDEGYYCWAKMQAEVIVKAIKDTPVQVSRLRR